MQPHSNTSSDTPRKQCTRCKKWFPVTPEFFHRNRRQKDGLHYWCKECNRSHVRTWCEENREYKQEQDRKAYRANPERYKKNSRRWRAQNHERKLVTDRRWRARNIEKIRRQKRKSERSRYHRDRKSAIEKVQRRQQRLRELPDNFNDQDREYVLSFFDHQCSACGNPASKGRMITLDHWVPLADPKCPGTTKTNMIPLCNGIDGCNNSKRDLDPKDWLIEKFGKHRAAQILERIEAYFETVRCDDSV